MPGSFRQVVPILVACSVYRSSDAALATSTTFTAHGIAQHVDQHLKTALGARASGHAFQRAINHFQLNLHLARSHLDEVPAADITAALNTIKTYIQGNISADTNQGHSDINQLSGLGSAFTNDHTNSMTARGNLVTASSAAEDCNGDIRTLIEGAQLAQSQKLQAGSAGNIDQANAHLGTEKQYIANMTAKLQTCATLNVAVGDRACDLASGLAAQCNSSQEYNNVANTVSCYEDSEDSPLSEVYSQHAVAAMGRCILNAHLQGLESVDVGADCWSDVGCPGSPAANVLNWLDQFPDFSCDAANPGVRLAQVCTTGQASTLLAANIEVHTNTDYTTLLSGINCQVDFVSFDSCGGSQCHCLTYGGCSGSASNLDKFVDGECSAEECCQCSCKEYQDASPCLASCENWENVIDQSLTPAAPPTLPGLCTFEGCCRCSLSDDPTSDLFQIFCGSCSMLP